MHKWYNDWVYIKETTYIGQGVHNFEGFFKKLHDPKP